MYSLNEIESAAKRAARGVGFPWGVAEEAGKSTRWLEAHCLPGTQALFGLLQKLDGGQCLQNAPVSTAPNWQAKTGLLCPLLTGCALSDRAMWLRDVRRLSLGPTLFPILLVPFIASIAGRVGTNFKLTWTENDLPAEDIVVSPHGVRMSARSAFTKTAKVVGVDIAVSSQDTPLHADFKRQPIDEKVWAGLSGFGHRTFAPATDLSRLTGAGAGTSDDD